MSETNQSLPAETLQLNTRWGTITLSLVDGWVTHCALPILDEVPASPFETLPASPLSAAAFFESIPQRFKPAPHLEGTDFQRAVWNAIAAIPSGETRTYGELAIAIGRPKAVRAVGSACGANPVPLIIPCHRVTAKNGLGGFSGGLAWKKWLLHLETQRPLEC